MLLGQSLITIDIEFFLKLVDLIHCDFNDLYTFIQFFVNKTIFYFENGLWKISTNIELKTMFIISLFSKNLLASVDTICNQNHQALKK